MVILNSKCQKCEDFFLRSTMTMVEDFPDKLYICESCTKKMAKLLWARMREVLTENHGGPPEALLKEIEEKKRADQKNNN